MPDRNKTAHQMTTTLAKHGAVLAKVWFEPKFGANHMPIPTEHLA